MKSFLLLLLFLFILKIQSAFSQAGAIDSTFNPTDVGYAREYGADGTVYATVIQNGGRIIIGGEFFNYDGVSRNKIARLNADGLLMQVLILNSYKQSILIDYPTAIQQYTTDGKIIVEAILLITMVLPGIISKD
jgi:hypothetical protein